MKKLVLLFSTSLIMVSLLFTPEKVISQGGLCESQGITEEGTGHVYCIGVGQTTCFVFCEGGNPRGGSGTQSF